MRRILAVVICVLGLAIPRASYACAVCIELPDASLADHILSAEVIVLAGPASDNPFRFEARIILKGDNEKLKSAPDIPFLIDSVTRRSFRSDPTRTVLLTYGPTYKENTGRSSSRHWRRLFILNPERHDFLEDLGTFGRLWAYGETDNPDRVLFFARYLGHSDHVLHNMALVEIGRAPYALLRPLSDRVPASLILQEFSDINRFAYRSAAIRLLGLQSDPQARSFVRTRYVRSLESGGLNSFEWALAGIETDQSTAISAIGAALQDPGKTKEHKKALIRALAEAGTLQSEFKPKIVQIFSAALENDPELLVQIAVATRNWGETALHQQFEALAALEETDLATQFVLNMVLGADLPAD